MALYFGATEITNIDNLVPQMGLDITDIWFGSTNVYTVWATYEGTLPATFNANGDDMRQYQVYGNTGGAGDRTVNLFDLSTVVFGKYIDSNGNEQTSTADPSWGTRLHHSDYFPVEAEQEYVFFSTCGARLYSVTVAFCWYDADKIFLSRTTTTLPVDASATEYSFNGVASQNARFAIVNFVTNRYANITITPGTTPPENYVPFGYKLDMASKTENLYNKNNDSMNFLGYINSTTLTVAASSGDTFSVIVPVEPNMTYTVVKPATTRFRIGLFTSYPNVGDVATTMYGDRNGNGTDYGTSLTFTTSSSTSYILAFIRNYSDTQATNEQMKNSTMVLKGSAVPKFYIPYSNTTTPIYIGTDLLEKDEYVDYQAGKIYRMINGTLTPTDPPVPLPALPTCEGATIVDYAGSGTAPEKVLLKYRKEGY